MDEINDVEKDWHTINILFYVSNLGRVFDGSAF
jgi:hypothetical protein